MSINIRVEYVIDYDDIPEDLVRSFREVFAEHELGNGARIQFYNWIHYLKTNTYGNELGTLQRFMKENELKGHYYIYFSW